MLTVFQTNSSLLTAGSMQGNEYVFFSWNTQPLVDVITNGIACLVNLTYIQQWLVFK